MVRKSYKKYIVVKIQYKPRIYMFFCSASTSLGGAQKSYELAKDHLGVRKAFGKELINNQVKSFLDSYC